MVSAVEPRLNREKHVKYWRRCAQLLPEPYTSGDSSRMSLGFFIVAALDLLGALADSISPEERQRWIDWIYTCQVPQTGGFRGFTGTMMGDLRSPENWHWDPANLPNTYFALATLTILGDDLSRVDRDKCLAWVARLQRPNGSFGESWGEDNVVEGEDDPRLCLCALGTIKILHGDAQEARQLGLNEAHLREFLANCQSQEGGIGQAPLLEAHSGLNYCAIGTLSFLGLIQETPLSPRAVAAQAGIDVPSCVRWMLDRQTTVIEDGLDEISDEDDIDEMHGPDTRRASSATNHPDSESSIAGFCGRCGKIADTCYCFWNVGALSVSALSATRRLTLTSQILRQEELVEVVSLRRYLLEKVAHMVGGFGKGPGELPDLLHSYLGLATLAIYHEPGLKDFDATFCFSKDAASKLDQTVWRRRP